MTYEEYLAKYGELTYRNVGVSMLPLIRQGRDTFTVRALHPGELCRRWDVVLYTRPPQSYVLRRGDIAVTRLYSHSSLSLLTLRCDLQRRLSRLPNSVST